MKVKRFIAILISILMMVSLMPMSVLAEGAEGEPEPEPAEGGIGLPVPLTDGGTLSTGYYYLESDVTLSKTIYIPSRATVTIDLNGHVLDRGLTSAEDNGCVIAVDGTLTIQDSQPDAEHDPPVTFKSGFDDSTLTVKGGVIRGGYNTGNGGGITVDNHLILKGGTIAGNIANRGGGIYTTAGSFVEMTGGKILANTATDTADGGGGGGIAIRGTLWLSGGTISDNKIAPGQNGCALRQYEGATTISGGVITRHSADHGGGIFLRGGTLTMSGGEIFGNRAEKGSGVSVTNSNVSFVMEGGTIHDNTATTDGGGVYVQIRSSFTMKGGTISKNHAKWGGGVYVTTENSWFSLEGGKISDNTADAEGGGVFVGYDPNFTMKGGTISGNRANNEGGGIFAIGATVFEMSGGKIENNTASGTEAYHGGGGICFEKCGFEMTGGTITGNHSALDGGGVMARDSFNISGKSVISGNDAVYGAGVYLYGQNEHFRLKGGTISGNKAQYLGGGVYMQSGTNFHMSAGSITGNTVESVKPDGTDGHGGGVFLRGAFFDMTGGTISKNSAPADGGGVWSIVPFSVSDGTISENSADRNGGGVCVTGKGDLKLTKATITDNIAGGRGGGVYPSAETKTVVSLKMDISGNVDSTGASDFLLTSGNGIEVSGVLIGEIGVDTDDPSLIITTCPPTAALPSHFYSNVKGYYITSKGKALEKDIVFTALEYDVNVYKYIENGTVSADKKKAIVNEKITLTVDPAAGYTLETLTYTPEGEAPVSVTDGEGSTYTFKMPANNVTVKATFTELLTGSVSVSGTAVYGQTLTASYEGGNNTGTISYKWKRDGADIEGADGNTYTLTGDDVGCSITCAAASTSRPGEVVSSPVTAGKAPITVTAEAASSEYGEAIATLSYTVSGSYVDGDALDITLGTTATETSDAGEYPITVTAGNNPNYEVTAEGAVYTIEQTAWTKTQAAMSAKRGGSGSADLSDLLADGAGFGAPSFTGDRVLANAVMQGTLLQAAVKNEAAAGSTAEVTIPVTGAKNYKDYQITVTVTVLEKDAQTLRFAEDPVGKIDTDEDFTVTAEHPEGDGTVTYAVTSGTDVATVDETSGKVHILGAGTAVITATAAESPAYLPASASYTLIVKPTYLVTVIGGIGGGRFTEGAAVPLKADPAPAGKVFAGWTGDDGVTFTDASAEETGFAMPAKDVTVTANYKDVVYVITDVTGVSADDAHTWKDDSGKEVVITVKVAEGADHSFAHFTGVKIDKKELKRDTDYTVREGSTIVTLNRAALKKLSNGAHTVVIEFDDGTAEMKLTVQKTTIQPEKIDNNKKTTPKTGDPNHPGFWIALLALAAAGIAVMGAAILRRRKKQ